MKKRLDPKGTNPRHAPMSTTANLNSQRGPQITKQKTADARRHFTPSGHGWVGLQIPKNCTRPSAGGLTSIPLQFFVFVLGYSKCFRCIPKCARATNFRVKHFALNQKRVLGAL
jgi:hypothetical protein